MPISEIIAVEEKEREAKQSHPGRWQKMAKPHAFTGKKIKNKPRFSANSFKIMNMLGLHNIWNQTSWIHITS